MGRLGEMVLEMGEDFQSALRIRKQDGGWWMVDEDVTAG